MQIAITERFLRDFRDLSHSLGKKCHKLISELRGIEAGDLRQQALPGWRLHGLRGSNMVSLSVDMNYRVLAQLNSNIVILHRVVKHDLADRDEVNRNDRAEVVARMTTDSFLPSHVYGALLSFGVSQAEAELFRECSTEDDLLDAASNVSDETAQTRFDAIRNKQPCNPSSSVSFPPKG